MEWNGVSITLNPYNLKRMESHPTKLDVFFTIILKTLSDCDVLWNGSPQNVT